MIEFQINPISGHSFSYLDVQFFIKFPGSDARIEIFNDTTKEQLDILSVSSGRIENENTIISKGTDSISGYINLFNKDKMNETLNNYQYVELKCIVHLPENIFESTAIFYNESKSLDSDIVPFDLLIDNPNIDLEHNIPLSMHVLSESEQKFELSIRGENEREFCAFQVIAYAGSSHVLLPSEIIWSDTKHVQKTDKMYQIYWCKPEGIDHMGMRGRKYIPIKNATIILSGNMSPSPQLRKSPTGVDLSPDFVLSSRYFVPTWKGFTSLGGLQNAYSFNRMSKISRFLFESQDINEKTQQSAVSSFSADQKVDMFSSARRDRTYKFNLKPGIITESFAKSYQNRRIPSATNQKYIKTFSSSETIMTPSKSPQKGCGCSRKK
jgi:hypothetical protein